MLDLISFAERELDDATLDRIAGKVMALGECYRCSDGIFFLKTDLEAGLVDAALRSVAGRDSTFVVVDITGITEEDYFGRVPKDAERGRCWDWVRRSCQMPSRASQ